MRTLYFARGQDAFKKFYADALCLAEMARRVADGLDLPAGTVSGFIGSSHVYQEDRRPLRIFWPGDRMAAERAGERSALMRVLFIAPRSHNPKQMYREYPLGIGLLGTLLSGQGMRCGSSIKTSKAWTTRDCLN